MPSRKPNMLEAWKAYREAPSQAPAPDFAPAPRPAPPPRAAAPAPRRETRGVQLPERAPIFLLLTLVALGLLAGAFWLGRATAPRRAEGNGSGLAAAPGAWSFPDDATGAASDRPREASDPTGEAADPTAPSRLDSARDAGSDAPAAKPEPIAQPRPSAAPALALDLDADGRTAEDRSFYDKTNRFTVRAIYYGNTPKGWKRALAAYRYLRGEGLPTIAPIDQGDIIVLCVGAEPEREGHLAQLREQLRNLPGPPPASERGAFAGAYFVNIDDLVERP